MVHGGLRAPTEVHGVATSSDVADALGEDGTGEDGGGGGPVTGCLVGLVGDVLDETKWDG